jgi:flagellar hook assembly protein FlgD
VKIDTYQRKGLNDVEVFVNPRLIPEQYYENNVFSLISHLDVVGELFNPVVDVSIDGRYIEKGDFVSANPSIMIRLWDENRTLIKQDTIGVSVFLAYPCQETDCAFTRINFKDPQVQWSPATETSDFTIAFNPANLQDGTYTLSVEAKDQTGNSADDEPYQISFQVKNESTATVSEPYPNPTKDQVNFNLILTGGSADIGLDVEIMNVNGILVNKFNTQSFPSFHVGRNVIQWEPRDGTGAQLPAGIYIYKLQVRSGTQFVRQRGKISIVR